MEFEDSDDKLYHSSTKYCIVIKEINIIIFKYTYINTYFWDIRDVVKYYNNKDICIETLINFILLFCKIKIKDLTQLIKSKKFKKWFHTFLKIHCYIG